MKKTEYFCNLCGDKKEKKGLKAMYFDYGQIPQKYILEYNRINDCYKHICLECIKTIQQSDPVQ